MSRGAKKRPLFKGVKAAITVYQQKMQNEFLPVLVKDFGSSIEVKFSRSKLSEEDKGRMTSIRGSSCEPETGSACLIFYKLQ